MALDDGGIKGDQHFLEPMPCGTENLSPYSNTSSFSDTPTYYSPDYDWQHQEQQQQQPQHHQPQHQPPQPPPSQQQPQQHPHHLQTHPNHLHESNLRYYGTFSADSVDMNSAGYPTFPSHTMPHSDYFPNNPAIWTMGQPDPIISSSNNVTSHPKFFSGVDLSQQFGVPPQVPNAISPSGHGGKPKRKRVQSHTQRKAANVRERRRMFHLNEAFDELRKRLPAFNYEKRLSRIETLRLAMTYIAFMKDVSVGSDPKCVKLKPHGPDLDGIPMFNSSSLGLKNDSPYSSIDSPDEGDNIDDSDECGPELHALGRV